jgi:hypothetical protein
MKNMLRHFRKILPVLAGTYVSEPNSGSFDFLKNKKNILKEMEFCLKEQNLVGIYSTVLGEGMFLVGVESIIYGDEGALVIFHPFDMAGICLSRRTLNLHEIARIVPFNNKYIAPQSTLTHPIKAQEVQFA